MMSWRYLLAAVPAYVCFWLGDLLSKPMYRWDTFAWLYPVYNRLMFWSSDLSEWGSVGLWKKVEPNEEGEWFV
jgi:hypothetical protein